jgi:hypothetical protein
VKRGAAIAGALAVGAALAALPPRARHAPDTRERTGAAVAGAFHVHTNRSDGSGSLDDVASAAARAGLQFVVVTDHGDGMRPADPPAYRSGVLVIDGVEVSTTEGHYAAIGLRPSPFPLGGEARDVVEDVARLGAFGVASHVDSPKADLRWTDRAAPVDGVEWLNLDTAWRLATGAQIARASIGYWFRKPETLALAMSRPTAALQWLHERSRRRSLVTLAATDAHGTFPLGYEACFRTLSTRLDLREPFSGDAARDGASLIQALREGRHYSVIDAIATPGQFEFELRHAGGTAFAGDRIDAGVPFVIHARLAAPVHTLMTLLRDGVPLTESASGEIVHPVSGLPGTYRVEARFADTGAAYVPWLVSNAIAVVAKAPREDRLPAADALDLIAPHEGRPLWHLEHDPVSQAAMVRGPDPSRDEMTFRFALAAGPARDQFAAIVLPLPAGFSEYDRVALRARSSKPLRLSVQLRELGNQNPPRWRRSLYLDETPREASVAFTDMAPVLPNTRRDIAFPSIGGLLLLLDTTHTPPGTTGEIVFDRIVLERINSRIEQGDTAPADRARRHRESPRRRRGRRTATT